MESKEIKLGFEARTAVKPGIDKAVAAVMPTLGATGMAAIIDLPGLDPIIADDGVTVLRNLVFKNRYEHMGMLLARQASMETSKEGGDGTATTACFIGETANQAFAAAGKKDSNIPKVVARLNNGLGEVLELLEEEAEDVTDKEDIKKIATVSSLDPEIGELIANMIDEVGVDGVITAETSPVVGYFSEVVKGARFDSGLLVPQLITNREKLRSELEHVAVILVDRSVATYSQLENIVKELLGAGQNRILMIADDIEGEALASIVKTQNDGYAKFICVKNPYTASRSKEFLQDIAVATGATVISEQSGVKMEDATIESHCGYAESVTSDQHQTTIVGGAGKQEDIDVRVKAVEGEIANTTVVHDREFLEKRVASLRGGIGVIRVGAYTDVEQKAKKYKIENAINSTKSALQEGVISGGGTAMFRLSKQVSDPMFKAILQAPLRQMAKNAGLSVKKFIKSVDPEEIKDAKKVQRLALENAVTNIKQTVTTGTAIVNEQ